jgi:hypothetical protein
VSDREALLNFLRAQEELERRKTRCPLGHFKPHGGQAATWEDFKAHECRIVIINAGNRWGKSEWNAATILCYLYGYWIHEVPHLELTAEGDYPPRSSIPPQYWIRRPDGVPIRNPSTVLLVTGLPLAKGIAQIIFPKLETLLPPAVKTHRDYRVARGALSVPMHMKLPNGSVVFFGSVEQAPMSFEGTNYDAVGFDEPPSRPVYQAVWRGCTDFYAKIWFSMTPLGPNAQWIYTELIQDENRDDIRCRQGSIHDNPYIPDAAKQEFLEGGSFNEEERRAREFGEWSFISSVAFPQWTPNVHIVPTRPIDEGKIRIHGCDPHHRRPYAMMWTAWGPDGDCEVYNESPLGVEHHRMRSGPQTIEEYAASIRVLEGRLPADYRVLDPRFGKAEFAMKGSPQTSVQDDFARLGLYFDFPREGISREETGILVIREMLQWDKTYPISPTNQPRLYVQEHCINTIAALARSQFKSNADPDVLPEALREAYKDFRDTLRYIVLADKPVERFSGTQAHGYLSEADLLEANDPESA